MDRHDGERESWHRAMAARDARFDGVFYIAVSTTGIYCRPVCPVKMPRRDRVTFYATAPEAEKAGYRACLRCRPEVAPGAGSVDALPRLVADAAALVEAGFLDEHSVDELAEHLEVSARHLRRAMEQELGVSPVELAQTRRMAMAKRLLHDTSLGLTEIALASGFGSVRRFNALFSERFGRAPSEIRRKLPAGGPPILALRLDTRLPFDWDGLLAFLGGRAIPGVEEIVAAGPSGDGNLAEYRRVIAIGETCGVVRVRRDAQRAALWAEPSPSLAGKIAALVPLLRRLFDLDARPEQIREHLERDPLLAPQLARRPGLRVPGSVDPFEIVCRAVLGQQVSVRAASTLAGRLVERFGAALSAGELAGLPAGSSLRARFPTPQRVAAHTAAQIAQIGLPTTRAQTLLNVANAFATGALASNAPLLGLARHRDPAAFAAALLALPGIGDWTAQYVAMRALGAPDAFPAGDLGIRKAMGDLVPKAQIARAEAWRPWRAYAVMHLWAKLGDDSPAKK
jgi:AraC family transcriptional regulator, regulatory protein of adaptative response / DNA-3-methyladenine glycosylase II